MKQERTPKRLYLSRGSAADIDGLKRLLEFPRQWPAGLIRFEIWQDKPRPGAPCDDVLRAERLA